ncbi:MAG: 30S ribosomal protein S20 [Desulfobacteraceae bacterium 4572_88]|nr:MAG: 30S ribosomal protein S20 [Desulfobacteraceae bacterium 4572_88]RLC19650.1 MAG: 30S ribosomal protein S20 [Deltaproteobacteria bacterium]
MANHKSALKRARQNEIRRIRNKSVRTRIKGIVKEVRQAVSESEGVVSQEKLNAAKSVIDKAAKKGVLHKKTASRKISRLSKLINAASA